MKFNKSTFGIVIIVVFWGIISVGLLSGTFITKESAEAIVVSSPMDLKGWMKVKDVAKYLGISKEEVLTVLALEASTSDDLSLKDLANEHDKEPDDYKELLDEYMKSKKLDSNKSISKDVQKDIPREANIKGNENNIGDKGQKADSEENSQREEKINNDSEEEIKGYMTFQQVSDNFNIPLEKIYETIGIPKDQNPNVPMRDVTNRYDFEVQEVRDLVNN